MWNIPHFFLTGFLNKSKHTDLLEQLEELAAIFVPLLPVLVMVGAAPGGADDDQRRGDGVEDGQHCPG